MRFNANAQDSTDHLAASDVIARLSSNLLLRRAIVKLMGKLLFLEFNNSALI